MPKIKLFKVHDRHYSNDYEDSSYEVLSAGISDWEDVSQADLTFIKNNIHFLKKQYPDVGIVLVEQLTGVATPAIKSIKKSIAEAQKVYEKRRAEEQARKDEAAVKRRLKKEGRDKAALLRLIAKNPELLEEIKGEAWDEGDVEIHKS